MNRSPAEAGPANPPDDNRSWWRLLNGYQWYVFVLAAFGWLFDCFDQQLFTMSRSITMRDLLPHVDAIAQTTYGGYATTIFILGWATGGLIFGTVGDRWGRARTMALTILVYAVCTGLSGMAHGWGYFALFRFLTGAGVGGEFAVGAALVAEVMPDRARPHALGFLQTLSTVGNLLAAVSLGVVVPSSGLGWGWRGLYFIGALPGLVAVFVFWRLREPERWVAARAAAVKNKTTHHFGRISELFTVPEWRRNTLVGLGLAIAGILGLWGVGFYSPELIDSAIPTMEQGMQPKVQAILLADSADGYSAAVKALNEKETRKYVELVARSYPPGQAEASQDALTTPLSAERREKVQTIVQKAITEDAKTKLKSIGGILQQLGAFAGMFGFTLMAARFGRRLAFLIAFLLAWGSILFTFATFHTPSQIWYLWPILGFGTFAPFGGYAIYFPELFPTRLRTTGTSFCYNVGRYVAAFGPTILGSMARVLNGVAGMPGFRVAALTMACCYLIGMVALIWAPETLGLSLPEDERGFVH